MDLGEYKSNFTYEFLKLKYFTMQGILLKDFSKYP